MRDASLFVSGELDTTIGGRPVDLAANPTIPRRSIYGFVNRDIVSSFASTFDGANPNSCTARRPDTNVPQQTLYALNSDFIQDRAAKFAALALVATDDHQKRVQWMYQRALAREPDAAEMKIALSLIKPDDSTSWGQLAHALLATNEFIFVD